MFPPLMFDEMTHLLIHLVEEIELYGPVQTCSMYPIERYMKTLKFFVINMSRPEESMVKSYCLEKLRILYTIHATLQVT